MNLNKGSKIQHASKNVIKPSLLFLCKIIEKFGVCAPPVDAFRIAKYEDKSDLAVSQKTVRYFHRTIHDVLLIYLWRFPVSNLLEVPKLRGALEECWNERKSDELMIKFISANLDILNFPGSKYIASSPKHCALALYWIITDEEVLFFPRFFSIVVNYARELSSPFIRDNNVTKKFDSLHIMRRSQEYEIMIEKELKNFKEELNINDEDDDILSSEHSLKVMKIQFHQMLQLFGRISFSLDNLSSLSKYRYSLNSSFIKMQDYNSENISQEIKSLNLLEWYLLSNPSRFKEMIQQLKEVSQILSLSCESSERHFEILEKWFSSFSKFEKNSRNFFLKKGSCEKLSPEKTISHNVNENMFENYLFDNDFGTLFLDKEKSEFLETEDLKLFQKYISDVLDELNEQRSEVGLFLNEFIDSKADVFDKFHIFH